MYAVGPSAHGHASLPHIKLGPALPLRAVQWQSARLSVPLRCRELGVQINFFTSESRSRWALHLLGEPLRGRVPVRYSGARISPYYIFRAVMQQSAV